MNILWSCNKLILQSVLSVGEVLLRNWWLKYFAAVACRSHFHQADSTASVLLSSSAMLRCILILVLALFIHTIVTTTWSPLDHQDAPANRPFTKANKWLYSSVCPFELLALFNAAFVEDFCFYAFRTVSYMSHQSVSEPSFPRLRKIMSGGTLGP